MKFVKFILFPTLCGIVLGMMIAHYTQNISALSWLSYGLNFGTDAPLVLDLGIFTLTFGISIMLNVATILCVVISLLVAKSIFKR
ncbi:MAG: DUF4321 domain-containing protein [Clostridia bacterium]|nr:DUF4321 domain-containing protein [Oscillospiraceae bacterium]MBQ6702935.1 DUF4321 domain-containing protein [Clostridia bacterium]